MTNPGSEAEIAVDPPQTPTVDESAPAQVAPDTALSDDLPDEAPISEQPTFVLPEQPTIILSPAEKRRPRASSAPTLAPAAPRPLTESLERAQAWLIRTLRLSPSAEAFLAERPWIWVAALLVCVCLLALISRRIGG